MAGDDDLELNLPDKLFFRIGEASDIVGVEAHVLRYWEGEFKLRPQRSASGQRMYRRKDLARLMQIKSLLHDQGFTIAGARKALKEGTAPTSASSESTGGADAERVSEAQDRVAALRKRVAAARERFSSVGVATPSDDG